MPNGNDGQDHPSSTVWNRLDQHGDQLSALARAQATTEANLAALANSVDSGFQTVNRALGRLAEKEAQPTNWIAIGIAAITVLGALVTFVTLVVAPIDARLGTVEANERANRVELSDRAFILGRAQNDIEWLKSTRDREQGRDK